MSENKLLQKLQRLYRLAILKPEEEGDDGRQNEARTSAFLLIKLARENGVQLKFIVPKTESPKAEPTRERYQNPFDPRARPSGVPSADFFEELFKDVHRAAHQSKEGSGFQRPQRTPNSKRPSRSGAPPIIYPQHPGRCRTCGQPFAAGERVWWVHAAGCAHERCDYSSLFEVAGGTG